MRDDTEAEGEGAVDADAEEAVSAGDQGAEVFQAEGFVGAGVETFPADGGRCDFHQAEAGGASGFGVADVDAEGALSGCFLD